MGGASIDVIVDYHSQITVQATRPMVKGCTMYKTTKLVVQNETSVRAKCKIPSGYTHAQ